jgi:hypothetical protein
MFLWLVLFSATKVVSIAVYEVIEQSSVNNVLYFP